MDPIASFSELDRVEGRHVVVSTFIADQRHKSSVRWLFDAYEWLHNRSGHHHIVCLYSTHRQAVLQFRLQLRFGRTAAKFHGSFTRDVALLRV
jgi:hypothetical protein